MASIICGNCTAVHASVAEVKACHSGQARHQHEPVTDRQRDYIAALCDRKGYQLNVQPGSKQAASILIKKLIAAPDRKAPVTEPTVGSRVYATAPAVPIEMLNLIQPGRYAVPNLDQTEMIFIRKVVRTTGRDKGFTIIQTQHADGWVPRMTVRPDGRLVAQRGDTIKGMSLADILIAVISDQTTAAMAYAFKTQTCSRCGTKLTDDRSRHYGIGPECEKHWPSIIGAVDELKGAYVPGAASQ